MNFDKIALKYILNNTEDYEKFSVKMFSHGMATYIFRTIQAYYSKFKKVPDVSILSSAISNTVVEDKAKLYQAYLKSLNKIDITSVNLAEILDGLMQTSTIKNVDKIIEELTEANFNKDVSKVKSILKVLDTELNISIKSPVDIKETVFSVSAIKYIDSFLLSMRDNNMRLGGLTIVGAPTGAGKSVFSYQQALYSYEQGLNVCVVSLEVPENEMLARLYSCANKEDFADIYKDEKNINLWKSEYFNKKNTFNIVATPLDTEELVKMIEVEAAKGTDLFVIDYLQLVESSSGYDEWKELAKLARKLHLLTLELGIIILSPVQINLMDTKVTDKDIKISVRGSRELENSSSLFLCIYADAEQYRDNVASLYTVKARNSRKVVYILETNFSQMRFEDTGVTL